MTERITFKDAIQKFMHVGEIYFRGHYDDNVLNIFNELTEVDKKALLRGLRQVYFLVEKGEEVGTHEVAPWRSGADTPEEEVSTSMTASSTFIIIMLLMFIFVLVALFITIGLDPSPSSAFKKLVKIIEFIF